MSEKQLAKLVVKLEAEIGKYQKEFDKAEQRHKKFAESTKQSLFSIKKSSDDLASGFKASLQTMAAAAAAFGVSKLFGKVITETSAAQDALRQLEATWKSTGGAVGLTVDEMVQEAARLQTVTIFGDDQIIAAQSRLATFRNVTGETFKQATIAALDLSSKLGLDLNSAIKTVGKSLNDPVKGLSALSKIGVQFTDEQKELVEALADTGHMAEAQRVILDNLTASYGGSAIAARDTFGGALKGLNNAFGDLFEADSLGGATAAINELTALLQSDKAKSAAGIFANGIVSAFSWMAKSIIESVELIKFSAESLAAFFNGPTLDDVVRRQEKIADLQNKILATQKNIAALEEQNFTSGRVATLKKQVAEYEKELLKQQELQATYESMQRSAPTAPKAPTVAPGVTPTRTPSAPIYDEFGQDEYGFTKKQDPFKASPIKHFEAAPMYDPAEHYDIDEDPFVTQEDQRSQRITEIRDQWREQELQKEAEFQAQILSFQESSSTDKVKTLLSEGTQMTQGAANTSKKLFAINKAFALANAVATLPNAVMQAVARGGGWPWGAAFGALTLANGLAQINAIKKASFSGGTSASLAGTGGGAGGGEVGRIPTSVTDVIKPDTQQREESRGVTNIILNGDTFGFDDFENKLLDVVSRASGTNRLRITDSTGKLILERT